MTQTAGDSDKAGAGPFIRAYGEAALMVELDQVPGADATALARAIAEAVRADHESGWGWPVPAYDTVLVPFDPERLDAGLARARLVELAGQAAVGSRDTESGQDHHIGVRYGREGGPDLETAAASLGLTPGQLIDAHAAVTYRVLVLGFAPGFAYLGTLPTELRLPRRDRPRPRVPAGSIAIAGDQSAIYPGGTAGGWHLIGRTGTVVWDVRREPPSLLLPGDTVRFEPRHD